MQVLSRLKPSYLTKQFTGAMAAGVAQELGMLAVDIEENKSWASMCARLNLSPNSSLANLRDAILANYEELEPDSRVKETTTATVLQYFELLCRHDDDLLYGAGNDARFAALDAEVAKDSLTSFLRLHYANVLQREEPKLPEPALRKAIADVASKLASNLSRRLAARYQTSGKITRGRYLHNGSRSERTRY